MEKGHFYGREEARAVRAETGLKGISNCEDLYEAMLDVWCAETCAPRMRGDWSKDNPTLGQCSITSFLIQDIFGGEVYGVPLPEGGYHCFNKVGDHVFDITSEQFGDVVLSYEDRPLQTREEHFADADKKQRYELLKSLLYERYSV